MFRERRPGTIERVVTAGMVIPNEAAGRLQGQWLRPAPYKGASMQPHGSRPGKWPFLRAFPRQDGSCPYVVNDAAVYSVLKPVAERVFRRQGFDQFQQQLDCIFHICQRGRFHRGMHIAQGDGHQRGGYAVAGDVDTCLLYTSPSPRD